MNGIQIEIDARQTLGPLDTMNIWTVGHSNRTIEELIEMLQSVSIKVLADVRSFPGSRRQPQFGQAALDRSLRNADIGYRHFPELGGRRTRRREDSPNGAWRVESFNAYADHMLTPEFAAAVGQLQHLARVEPTAIMCAEAVPWRCHRRLISDILVVRGWTVLDIFSTQRVQPHALTRFAQVRGDTVVYPLAAEI